jgi:hypothetical protein
MPDVMQQRLKFASRAARAQIVAAELLGQFEIAVDDATAAFDAAFRGVGAAAFARDLKSRGACRERAICLR